MHERGSAGAQGRAGHERVTRAQWRSVVSARFADRHAICPGCLKLRHPLQNKNENCAETKQCEHG